MAAKKRTPVRKQAAKKAPRKRVAAKKSWRDRPCAKGVCDPERTQGLRAPAPQGDHQLVTLAGPGVFLGAQVTKQGGNTGITFVDLTIDGRNVTNFSFAAAENTGLTQQNPYGLVLLGDSLKTMTIGWPSPLRFDRDSGSP